MAVERCPRCGTARAADALVCIRCETPYEDVDLEIPRPAAPSPTQSHGTMLVGVLGGFVVLGLLLYLSVRGIGPFQAQVVSTTRAGSAAAVTLRITNEGRKVGRGKCAVERVDANGDKRTSYHFLSDPVPPHQSRTQTVTVPLDPGITTGLVSC